MSRGFILSIGLLFIVTQQAAADERYGPRIRIGRVEFGIPFVDSFVTVHGDRATVKVFSRGDITNVHTDGGTRVDVGIRSLFVPRRPLRGSEPEAFSDTGPTAGGGSPSIDLGESQPFDSAPVETPAPDPKRDGPLLPLPEGDPLPKPTELPSASSLEDAEAANARGDYRSAEKIASSAIERDENNQDAYSIRAASRIGQGEQAKNVNLVRQGLVDVKQAIKLGNENDSQNKRDYVVWFIGMNQLAALDADRRQAARNAKTVDDFATQHIDRFPDELKEQVFRQQGYARLLLGKRAAAEQSFRQADAFTAGNDGR